jgi:hypothetical protein
MVQHTVLNTRLYYRRTESCYGKASDNPVFYMVLFHGSVACLWCYNLRKDAGWKHLEKGLFRFALTVSTIHHTGDASQHFARARS